MKKLTADEKILALSVSTDRKIDALSANVDRKIDVLDKKIEALSVSVDRKIDEKIEDFAAMVAREFTEVHKEISEVLREMKASGKRLERHCKESEKTHERFNKRFVVLERLQNI
jgi:hypothetical protein